MMLNCNESKEDKTQRNVIYGVKKFIKQKKTQPLRFANLDAVCTFLIYRLRTRCMYVFIQTN